MNQLLKASKEAYLEFRAMYENQEEEDKEVEAVLTRLRDAIAEEEKQ